MDMGFDSVSSCLNLEIKNNGIIIRRREFKNFANMVNILWQINQQNKKMGFTCEYTIVLPMKGTKKSLKNIIEKL